MTENKKMGNLSTPVHSLAALPSVDRLLGVPAIATLGQTHGQSIVVRAIRQILDERRQRFQSASLYAEDLSQERLVQDVEQTLGRLLQPSLRPVINLSGTVLHTNLGRALLPERAVEAVVNAMRHPVNLEYALEAGHRGDRDDLIRERICALTGADRKSTRLNSSHVAISYAVFCLKKKKTR